jgi:type I restriction enzyme M protein
MSSGQILATQRPLTVQRNRAGKIWSHVRQRWLDETPEERVRQEYLCVLVNEYGYDLDQIAEEMELTGRGTGHARADFVIWRSAIDKQEELNPLVIVECKSDNVTIRADDYSQGDNYARIATAPFVVTHNNRETKYWRVRRDRMPGYLDEIENIPHADASDAEIKQLVARLKVFKEDEFADLLHKCHNIIRNRDHLDPAAAFDEIAKILFVKVWVERELRRKRKKQNLFTVEFLDSQLGDRPLDGLFRLTKEHFEDDLIFTADEEIELKPATSRAIVKELEKYNLSDTSEDVKGIAFERFLGRTFRGEIGQFFTPRTIVEFMIRMVAPQEGEIICDPASGSGGFLIRFFEIVREQILQSADEEYAAFKQEIEARDGLSEADRAGALREKYAAIQESIDPAKEGSRLWRLANRCIYGTDANERMARTSKMNMIMHGDGHGGVHHHNGFLNVNGIYEDRFKIILTNPPFGANVEPTDKVTPADVELPRDDERRFRRIYGEAYREARARTEAAVNQPIAALFDLGKNDAGKLLKVKTEVLFVERCLQLLAPEGRLGIVLPEGIFNNPSLDYVREYCEDRAFIQAVVSLPLETFFSSGASVKASLLFLQKFSDEEKQRYDETTAAARAETEAKYAAEIARETEAIKEAIAAAKRARDRAAGAEATKRLRDYERQMAEVVARESRALVKERFNYFIFFYDAEKVGITATGEEDENELFPNDRVPAGCERTCLELFRDFVRAPESFLLERGA